MTEQACTAPFAVVDMGSNGIRFGIISAFERHLPVTFEERAPISLLDAQTDEGVIPDETIDQTIVCFKRFKILCDELHVRPENVRVIATEATRIATNAEHFLTRIYDETGWKVTLLSKEEEALISAAGIVGTSYDVNGLTMDLGGGSFELSYVLTDENGAIDVCKTPVSLPYGSVALKKRLARCATSEDRANLYQEIVASVSQALSQVQPPSKLAKPDGFQVYMTGGSLRSIGYLSMSLPPQKQQYQGQQQPAASSSTNTSSSSQPQNLSSLQSPSAPRNKDYTTYPIPIISGYSISGSDLHDLATRYMHEDPKTAQKQLRCFRVSKRRAGMVPAVCFLLSAVLQVLEIDSAHFSQGGVRQGLCYQLLPPEEQAKDPLLEGVKAYLSTTPHSLADEEYDAIYTILTQALAHPYMAKNHPLQLHRLLPSAIHLANLTSHYPKESRGVVSFHLPLSSGPLANVPGLSHKERAALALLLAYRQGGKVPDPIFDTVQGIVGTKGTAVCKFVGRLMELIFAISPLRPGLGLMRSGLQLRSHKQELLDSSRENYMYPRMELCIQLPKEQSPMVDAPMVQSVIESLDQRINVKKFDMDEEQRSGLEHPRLFTVTVVE
ncbi:Ppx/GppA phosphatase family-domain-containing protein [Syncephalastrum racemosum]|uniref:Ppx/GppA phosphatase family-domain-containing protein n=1 Tax=Syncephalastrum racemosum TaxID=13706 RepID=A0A1X2HTS1_SYNRA|nr:Ppx/GppA phosphatase family-domain-containing protein [Syncephalastrum racemosum]